MNVKTRNRQANLVGAIGFFGGALPLILALTVGLGNPLAFEESWKHYGLGGILFLIALSFPLWASRTCRRA